MAKKEKLKKFEGQLVKLEDLKNQTDEVIKEAENMEEKPVETDDHRLPEKSLFRVDEVADYFGITDRTVRLWIEHGHLQSEKIVGTIRISRESILKCRIGIKIKEIA